MRRRARAGAIGALGVTLLVSGCAPVAPAAWNPPVWEVSSLEIVDAVPAPLDASALVSLTSRRLRNDAAAVQARYALLPGTDAAVRPFNTSVEEIVRSAVGSAAAARGVSYSPQASAPGAGLGARTCVAGSTTARADEVIADPALGPPGGAGVAVVCDLVVAAGPILGERIRVVRGGPDGIEGDTSRILYADTASGDVVGASDLWGETAAVRLGDDLVELLRREAGALSLSPPAPPGEEQLERIRAALATTVPVDGAYVITIAPGFTSPELEGLGVPATAEAMHVRIPGSVAQPLLTEFGASLLAASGEVYAGPIAVPAGQEWLDCALLPCVAVTYDDGPSGLTPGLLDILAERRAAATFFMLGQSAAGQPGTVRRVAAEGHEIGNHTWNHPSLPSLSAADVRGQLSRTADVLRPLSGQPVALFRPPYGEFTAAVLAAAAEPAILWTVDTRDWAGPADDVLISTAVGQPAPGGIVLFHDTHERSVRVAPMVIDGLRDRGFVLATVSQLFGGTLPASGAWRAAP